MTPPDLVDERRGPRFSTLMWGLVVIVIGLAAIAWGLGVSTNLGVTLAVVLGTAGIALVIVALVPKHRQ